MLWCLDHIFYHTRNFEFLFLTLAVCIFFLRRRNCVVIRPNHFLSLEYKDHENEYGIPSANDTSICDLFLFSGNNNLFGKLSRRNDTEDTTPSSRPLILLCFEVSLCIACTCIPWAMWPSWCLNPVIYICFHRHLHHPQEHKPDWLSSATLAIISEVLNSDIPSPTTFNLYCPWGSFWPYQ